MFQLSPRLRSTLATITLIPFAAGLFPMRSARADAPPSTPIDGQGDSAGTGGPPTLATPSPNAGSATALATVDLATGEGRASFAFQLPTARGQAQPTLSLMYSSASGAGLAGYGWTLELPSIERRGSAGMPRFDDDVMGTSPLSDRYVFAGSPLVPICTVGGTCPQPMGLSNGGLTALPTEDFPGNVGGYTYFRTEVDNGMRFFYAPSHEQWVVQTKLGVTLTFGVPGNGLAFGAPAVERRHEPLALGDKGAIVRWNLAEQEDQNLNAVHYAWAHYDVNPAAGVVGVHGQGREYLTDIYDTLPATSNPRNPTGTAAFAHHVHLAWSTVTYGATPTPGRALLAALSPSWNSPPAQLLSHVDVTSSPFGGGPREVVRRYWLNYTSNVTQTRSQLASIVLEGTCGGHAEGQGGLLPDNTGCPMVPALSLTYTPSLFGLHADNFVQGMGGLESGPYIVADAQGNAKPQILYPGAVTRSPCSACVATTPELFGAPSYGSNPTYALGNWFNDGRINWLWFDASYHATSTPSSYEIYGNAATDGSSTNLSGKRGQLPLYPYVGGLVDFQTGRAADVDGDGLTDMFLVPTIAPPDNNINDVAAYFSAQDATGAIQPFAMAGGVQSCPNPQLYGKDWAHTTHRVVADMDGDGLSDIVVLENVVPYTGGSSFGYAVAHVFKNRGDGRFGGAPAARLDCKVQDENDAFSSYDVPINTGGGIDDQTFQGQGTTLHDLDGDGLADFVWLDVNGIHVEQQVWNPQTAQYEIGLGGDPRLPTIPTSVLGCTGPGDNGGTTQYNQAGTALEFGDAHASGIDDIFAFACGEEVTLDLNAPTAGNAIRPGLLSSITNDVGLTTTLTYASFADYASSTTQQPPPPAPPVTPPQIPVPAQIVTQAATTNGLSGPGAINAVTTYAYSSPVYDTRDHLFLGFQTVIASRAGDGPASPGVDTVTKFVTDACIATPAAGCPATRDYYYRMARGLPAVVEQHANAGSGAAGSGPPLLTTVNTYAYNEMYPGQDGRVVRQVQLSQTDEYPWDGNSAAPVPTTRVVLSGDSAYKFPVDVSVPGTGSAGGQPTPVTDLRRTYAYDPYGNETVRVDLGNVGVDTPISVRSTWRVASVADGWTFRLDSTVSGYSDASGLNQTPPLREADYVYNSQGHVTSVSAPLIGSLPLLRQNPAGATAPAPPFASKDGTVQLLKIEYDNFGNPRQISGPNNQCTGIVYDSQFSQLPTETDQYLLGCGNDALKTSRMYDRGLEVVLQQVSPALQVSSATYDAFGRMTQSFQPSPAGGGPSTVPSVTVDYSEFDDHLLRHIAPNPPVLPVRILKVSTNVGTEASPTYASTWHYFDGGGRKLVSVQQSDQATGPFVVLGATLVGASTGRVLQAWRPFAPSTQPPFGDAYDVQAGSPTGPFKSFTYDGLGRVIQVQDELKRASKIRYDASLTEVLQDAEQVIANAGSQHTAASTTLQYDGHGRLTQSLQAIANPGVDQIATAFTYLASGEVTQIAKTTQTKVGPRGASQYPYVRTMVYDTLGRLVANEEPNTSSPNVALGGWRYAYNDSGRLVGTSDGRGCGENLTYDFAGRLAFEDYSPCEASQLPCSPVPDAIYVHDREQSGSTAGPRGSRGYLTAIFDRGQQEHFGLDGRGRPVNVNRQVSKITSAGGYEYAPHLFSRQFSYDDANRVISATTGADVPELAPAAGNPARVVTSYALRGGVNRIDSPYGNGKLLTQRTFDPSNQPLSEQYGDTRQTKQLFAYNLDESLQELATLQGTASLQDLHFAYDNVNNPTSISDQPTTSWAPGLEPATKSLAYDDMYRVTSVGTKYGGNASGTDPNNYPAYAPERAAGNNSFPAPVPGLTNRVESQSYQYDWLDNAITSDDDTHTVPDRSFGYAVYGTSSEPQGTYANNQLVVTGQGSTNISVGYDAAGNTTSVLLNRGSSTSLCTGVCSSQYGYVWDEVGRLAYAIRVDQDANGSSLGEVIFAYAYDASGGRVLKQEWNNANADRERQISYHVSVFPSLRLDTDSLDTNGDYSRAADTESVYLQDGAGQTYARALYVPGDGTGAFPGGVRQYLEFGDHLGSTSFVDDFDTGDIVERSTYLAYGGPDADYRNGSSPSQLGGSPKYGDFRETYRYTGHDDDSEVGLSYAGARYYIPLLSRWASPDPLTIHGLGSQLNPYAYAANSPFKYVDPFGLQDIGAEGADSGGGYQFGEDPSPYNNWTITPADVQGTAGGAGGEGRGGNHVASVPNAQFLGAASAPPVSQVPRPGLAQSALQGTRRLLLILPIGGPVVDIDRHDSPLVAVLSPIIGAPASKGDGTGTKILEAASATLLVVGGLAGSGVGSPTAAAESVAPSSRALGLALEEAGMIRGAGEAAHHIVAGAAPEAAGARAVLQRFGIGINDAANGVFLPGNLAVENTAGAAVHSTVHTSAYYQSVNAALAGATTKQQVFDILQGIGQALKSGGFP